MEAKELRQGNIIGRIYFNPAPTGTTIEVEPVFVKAIGEEMINTTMCLRKKERFKAGFASFTPIMLTEEWLVKFGFEEKPEWLNGLWIVIESDMCLRYVKKTLELWGLERVKIFPEMNVHQLQNLFFSLTGEELTLKT